MKQKIWNFLWIDVNVYEQHIVNYMWPLFWWTNSCCALYTKALGIWSSIYPTCIVIWFFKVVILGTRITAKVVRATPPHKASSFRIGAYRIRRRRYFTTDAPTICRKINKAFSTRREIELLRGFQEQALIA